MTEDLRSRADELHAQVTDGEADLSTIVRLADELGGTADRLAATFDKVNEALEQHDQEEEVRPSTESRELTEDLAPAGRDEQAAESGPEGHARPRGAAIEIPGPPGTTSGNPT